MYSHTPDWRCKKKKNFFFEQSYEFTRIPQSIGCGHDDDAARVHEQLDPRVPCVHVQQPRRKLDGRGWTYVCMCVYVCVCVCICAYKCIDMYTYYMHMYAYILRACPAATLQTGWSLWDLCVYMSIRVYMCMYTYYTYIYVDVCTSMYGIYTCTCTDIHAHVHIQNRRVRRRAARLTRRRLAFPRCARPCSRRARHTRRRVCLSRWRPFCSAHSQKSVPW